MRQSRQSERVQQFVGATPEEAVRRAREGLGDDAPVRCFKTRAGGVMGFFAREGYVASLEAPAGARTRAATPTPPPSFDEVLALEVGAANDAPLSPEDVIATLAAAMDDDVDVRLSEAALAEFSSVLAQAEAALQGTDHLDDDLASSPSPTTAGVDTTPAAVADDSVTYAAPAPTRSGPAVIPGLRDSLARLGVPSRFIPEVDGSLDALVRALDDLDEVPSLPETAGSLLVVIGSDERITPLAETLAITLGLGEDDIVRADLTRVGRLALRRRREAGSTTVVVVEAPLRGTNLDEAAAWVDTLAPAYVMATVDAAEKTADLVRWTQRFSRVDAVALSGCAATTTPAELMGQWPIAYLEDEPATSLRWTRWLLAWMEEASA